MVMGNLLAGAAGGATVSIIINAVDNFSKTFGAANAGMAKLGAGLTAVGIAGAVAVGGLLKMAGQFEQTTIAFTTMLGSAEKADKLLQDLAEFASRTPFTIPGIEQNAKMLLAMSIELDDLLPTLKMLGDVSAGLNVPMERLALNFGQVKVQGRLTGRELRDFSVAGVPLVAELAKNLNMAESDIKEMVTAGKIGFADVEEAFRTMTSAGGKFADLMDEQSKTFLGKVSNIKDSFIRIARIMGKVFLPAAKAVAERLSIIVGWLEQHPTIATAAAIFLGLATAFALIVGPLLIMVAMLPLLIAGFATLSAVTLPMTLSVLAIAAAILAVIAASVWLWKHWETLGVKTKLLLAILFPMITLPIAILKNWNNLKVGLASVWNFIVKLYAMGANKIIGYVNKLIDAYNAVASFFGRGTIGNVSEVTFSGAMFDIEAIRAGIKEQEKATEEIAKQSTEIEKQTALVKRLQGYKVLAFRDAKTGKTTFSDVFKEGAFSTRSEGNPFGEFQSGFNAEQARRGGGVAVTIDNIYGIDPDEIAIALNDKLVDIINTQ